MKIVVTGSLGNISKPLTKLLVEKGHSVTVISSDPRKQSAIEALHNSRRYTSRNK
jgi:NAD(P)H dehydrogenase (quinone)